MAVRFLRTRNEIIALSSDATAFPVYEVKIGIFVLHYYMLHGLSYREYRISIAPCPRNATCPGIVPRARLMITCFLDHPSPRDVDQLLVFNPILFNCPSPQLIIPLPIPYYPETNRFILLSLGQPLR